MSNFLVKEEGRNAIKLYEATTLRGGASIIEVNGKVITFGGVDREQNHLNECIVCQHGKWLKAEEKGDVPTARSGHAVATYGKFMFLYGGIDFTEEIAYNDLYILDTESMEWKYVGEAGMELKSRNSHSLGIVNVVETQSTGDSPSSSVNSYLVVYGGASPEEGPMGDTVYALLPADPTSIDITTFFVTWQLLSSTSSKTVSPGKREMHGTSSWQGNMVIVGGRDEQGNVLSDVWTLTGSRVMMSSDSGTLITPSVVSDVSSPNPNPITNPTETKNVETAAVVTVQSGIQELKLSSFQAGGSTFETEVASEGMSMKEKELSTAGSSSPLMWIRLRHLELPVGRCAHGAAVLDPNTIDGVSLLCLYGGFTAEGSVSETVIATPLSLPVVDAGTTQTPTWTSANVVDKNVSAVKVTNNKGTGPVVSTLGARFGHAVCSASVSLVHDLLQPASKERITTSCCGFLVFGGVSPERDYGDVWLVL